MIRKISVQDIVSKRTTKSVRGNNEKVENDPNRQERDYLIERLTRKRIPTPTNDISNKETPIKSKKRHQKVSKFKNKWIWFVSPLVLLIFVFIVLNFMVSAVVTIKPKQQNVQIDSKLIASRDATTSPNVLSYQIITLNDLGSETVLATSTTTNKPQKASGQITIFNNYSSAPQTLVATTRFETSNGLIYCTPNTVQIPGFTVSGGKTIPGSITIKVVADKIGSKYNIGNTSDFTIPGFKTNNDRYTKIFARSKDVMGGGTDENSFGISETVRQSAIEKIEARLRESLSQKVQSLKTADSIIFDTASKTTFQNLADTAGADAQHAVVNIQGTISAVAFDKKMLSKILVNDAIKNVGNSAEIQGLDKLHFIAIVSSSPVWQSKPFNFTLTGSVDVVGVVDKNKIIQSILGIPRSDFNKVLSNYPTIDKATAVVKPFWKRFLPNNASKIKIEILK